MNSPGWQVPNMLLEKSGEMTPERMKRRLNKMETTPSCGCDWWWKWWCCREQYCTGTWNVRSMNQSKLEAVKQDMARVNNDILWISKLKWTGMGKFNSDDHYYSHYCGQKSLRRNGVALIVNKRVQNEVLGYNLKNDRMICFQGKQFNITVIQVYAQK